MRTQIPDRSYWKQQIKCQDACPVHTDARGYVRAIAAGDYEKAYLIARGPNPLASMCGRVCGAPCEANCRREDIDSAIAIRALKRFASEHCHVPMQTAQEKLLGALRQGARGFECADVDEAGPLALALDERETRPGKGRKVAIVGSGPAGLAAAHDLALFGFMPVIYERESVAAGMLHLGVPKYRLPRDVIRTEVAFIQALGVEIKTNVEVGKGIALATLLDDYEAVVVAVGAQKSRMLPLAGVEGGGVLGGLEFLREVNLDREVTLGEEVVVIGGGNVAYDVARSTVRHLEGAVSRSVVRLPGVQRVHLCCLESRGEMPADDIEIDEGREEGIDLRTRLGPHEVIRDAKGRITGVRFKVVESVFDQKGRFAPVFKEGVFEEVPGDTVIFAIGQAFDLAFLEPEKNGIALTPNGLPKAGEDLSTTRKGLYIAGDVCHGPGLMIDAIAEGKRAARSICEALTGVKLPFEAGTLHAVIGEYAREEGFETVGRRPVPTETAQTRRASTDVIVERGYEECEARCEAGRCLDCGVNTIFDGSKCILCGGCADICPELCLKLVTMEQMESNPELHAVLETMARAGRKPESSIVKDETRCIRCGCCADRCPVGAITMERFTFKEVSA